MFYMLWFLESGLTVPQNTGEIHTGVLFRILVQSDFDMSDSSLTRP